MTSLSEQTERSYEYRGVSFVKGNDSITDEKLAALVQSPKMREWVNDQVDFGFVETTSFKVNDIKFFGPVAPERVGFIVGEGTSTEVATRDKIASSYVFIRGGSVAIFVRALVVDKDGEIVGDYGIFTEQIRYPVGRTLQEACAGCVDSQTKNIKGVALTELEEELGIIINTENGSSLVSLGSIVPSGGGTYESIELFYLSVTLTEAEVKDKINRVFGVDDTEKIRLIFVPIEEMDAYLDKIGDVKAECAWRRIQYRGNLGQL
jgi:hypothetical protein